MPALHLASDFAHLVWHTFAFMDVPGENNLYDLEFQRWTRSHLPLDAWQIAYDDASLLSVMYAREPRAHVLQSLPQLHHNIEHFRASARYPIETLTSEDVADVALLKDTLSLDRALVEILRTNLSTLSREFSRAFNDAIVPIMTRAIEDSNGAFELATTAMPLLSKYRIELGLPLGAKWRSSGSRIWLGAPAPWNAIGPEILAIEAMHIAAGNAVARRLRTRDAIARRARAELRAFIDVAKCIERTSDSLRAAHREWLAARALSSILEHAGRMLTPERIAQIQSSPNERPELFRGVDHH